MMQLPPGLSSEDALASRLAAARNQLYQSSAFAQFSAPPLAAGAATAGSYFAAGQSLNPLAGSLPLPGSADLLRGIGANPAGAAGMAGLSGFPYSSDRALLQAQLLQEQSLWPSTLRGSAAAVGGGGPLQQGSAGGSSGRTEDPRSPGGGPEERQH